MTRSKGGYVVPFTKEQLKAAPAYSINELTGGDGTDGARASYDYYKVDPYWALSSAGYGRHAGPAAKAPPAMPAGLFIGESTANAEARSAHVALRAAAGSHDVRNAATIKQQTHDTG